MWLNKQIYTTSLYLTAFKPTFNENIFFPQLASGEISYEQIY